MKPNFSFISLGEITELLRVIIWPLTLLIIVFRFRTFFGGAINRVQSIDASASGISMTFQNKIDEAKVLLSKMRPQLKPMAKSASVEISQSAYERVVQIKKELENLLTEKAKSQGIQAEKYNPTNLSAQLTEIGLLTFQQQKAINAALDLANSANSAITPDQALVIEQLYETVKQ